MECHGKNMQETVLANYTLTTKSQTSVICDHIADSHYYKVILFGGDILMPFKLPNMQQQATSFFRRIFGALKFPKRNQQSLKSRQHFIGCQSGPFRLSVILVTFYPLSNVPFLFLLAASLMSKNQRLANTPRRYLLTLLLAFLWIVNANF